MQLARFAVQARAVVVEDAVGDVGGLLDLGDVAAAADGVDAAGRQEEHVAGLYLVAAEDVGDGAIGYFLFVLFGGDLVLEAHQQVCAFIGPYYVPHLGLALAAVVAHRCQFVVGVHLDAQVLFGVDVFHQHGELVTGVLVHVLSDELSFILFGEFCDGLARQRAFCYHAFVVHYAGKLPALRAPYQGLYNGFEFKRLHSFDFAAQSYLFFDSCGRNIREIPFQLPFSFEFIGDSLSVFCHGVYMPAKCLLHVPL